MKHKYLGIALVLLLGCIVGIWCLLVWGTRPATLPQDGIWYCAELDATIDCSAQPTTITIGSDNGTTQELLCDYGGRCYIAAEDNRSSPEKFGFLVSTNPFRKDILMIQLCSDDMQYTFKLVK